jgi:hypothetical protein
LQKLGFIDTGRIEPDATFGDSVIMSRALTAMDR